jgi:hypothetical protein
MTKRTDILLKVLNVIAWIVFIGLCIESGALIFNFSYSMYKPIVAENIYKGLDLSDLQAKNFAAFIGLMSFIVLISTLKAYLFYMVVKIFMKLNFVKPFSVEIAKLVENISLEVLSIAIVGAIAKQYTKRLKQLGYDISNAQEYWNDTAAFLIMAATIYVIAQVFKKGIELQNENDLTI